MPRERADMRACLRIPQTDGAVPTPTCERAAIRTKRYTTDRTRMPRERADMRACLHIPQTDGAVITPTCERADHQD